MIGSHSACSPSRPGWAAGMIPAIMDERQTTRGGPLYWLGQRSRRFWIVAAVIIPVSYVASFGPPCRLADRGSISVELTAEFYRPVIAATRSDEIRWAMLKYVRLFLQKPRVTMVAGPPQDIISKLYPLTWEELDRESVKAVDFR